jgi:hypothetical protein
MQSADKPDVPATAYYVPEDLDLLRLPSLRLATLGAILHTKPIAGGPSVRAVSPQHGIAGDWYVIVDEEGGL